MPNINEPFSNCGNNLVNMGIGKKAAGIYPLNFVIVFSQKMIVKENISQSIFRECVAKSLVNPMIRKWLSFDHPTY